MGGMWEECSYKGSRMTTKKGVLKDSGRLKGNRMDVLSMLRGGGTTSLYTVGERECSLLE
jgi:hypothetical protein